MSDAPVPMNRGQRRKTKQREISPENVPFTLALLHRREQQQPDGTIYAQSFFKVIAPNGKELCEETPDGPRAVMLASIPQPVRRALLARSSRLVTV